jgi:NAD+ synthase (glutamine-hydrolysing)
MFAQRARDNICAYAICGQVGGQDELVFDGSSAVIDHDGEVIARAPQFLTTSVIAEIDAQAVRSARLGDTRPRASSSTSTANVDDIGAFATGAPRDGTPHTQSSISQLPHTDEEIYAALVCGTRDYAGKNGFDHAVLGLSGGIDSALVLAIAVDALGPDRVTAVVMPSPYSSEDTQGDARALAQNIGAGLLEFGIAPAMEIYREVLRPVVEGHPPGLRDENLQSRIRGNLLMALSNTFGWLVLTTGNKSELAVGYSTLYGDSAGGFAVIKDCPKTLVFRLMALRAARTDAGTIPPTILTRPPSAELRPDQKDSDSLPDYPVLDAILEGYIEHDLGREQLLERGLPAADIDRTVRLVDLAEYKRRQNPPGIKVTSKAFGRDGRMPNTNRFGN